MQWQQVIQVIRRLGNKRRHLWTILTGLVGMLLFGLGFALALIDLTAELDSPAILEFLTLEGIPQPLRTLIFLVAGAALLVYTLLRINEFILALAIPGATGSSLLNLVYERMTSAEKPHVVVFGSGIGLFIMLNAIKDQVSSVDIVLPMGEDVQLYEELLNANHLKMHHAFVATISGASLSAKFTDGEVIEGFLAIKETRHKSAIEQLYLKPHEPATTTQHNADLITAINDADAIIFGPTSLYSGIVASILPPDVSRALSQTAALKIFICPVMTEPGKTDNYSVSDHVTTVEKHGGFALDYVILNNKRISYDLARKYYDYGAEQVLLDLDEFEHTFLKVDFSHRLGEVRQLGSAVLIDGDMINASVQRILGQQEEKLVVRHDPDKLKTYFAKVFDHIEYRRTLNSREDTP